MVRPIYSHLVRAAIVAADDARPKMHIFGLFAIVGFPLYYVVWAFLFPQPYENLYLRAAGMLLAAPTLFVDHWPQPARRYLPIYWLCFMLLAIPFFFTFMLLQNGVNTVWSGTLIIGIVILLMTFGLANSMLMLGIGIAGAFLVYAGAGSGPLPWHGFAEQVPVYLFAIGTVTMFNLESARQNRAKIGAAMALGGHIAHELRTPLATIQAASDMIGARLPRLLSAVPDESSDKVPDAIRGKESRLVLDAPTVIGREVEYAFLVIDLALTNTGFSPLAAAALDTLDIAPAIQSAIGRYPFKDPAQRDWVKVQIGHHFQVNAIAVLIDHVIFNLLKNSIYAIQAAGRGNTGEIRIWTVPDRHRNQIYIRDNGQGIAPAVVARVFDPFFSTRANGTGLGLHFCQTVMGRFGGGIRCHSVPGEFTEMILEFPAPDSLIAR